MNVIEKIIDGASLQRYALIKLFEANPNKVFTRNQIFDLLEEEPYHSLLTKSNLLDPPLEYPFARDEKTNAVPTNFLDRLAELEDLEILELPPKRGREVVYKLHSSYRVRNREEDLLEISTDKKSNISILLQWQQMFEKFEGTPIADEIKTFLESNHIPKNAAAFRAIDFETSLSKNKVISDRIRDFYAAIEECSPVNIRYYGSFKAGYKTQEFSIKKFQPHLLKESSGIWYVIGNSRNDPEFRHIALDRIFDDYEILYNEEFKRDISFNPDKYFSKSVGITVSGKSKDVEFELRDGEVYYNIEYLRSSPIVKNQLPFKRNPSDPDWVKVTLKDIYIGPELIRRIRTFGQKNVRNVKPAWLEADLWENAERQKEINFSYELGPGETEKTILETAKKLLRIQKDMENEFSKIDVSKIPNKKSWVHIKLENIVVNSVVAGFIDFLRSERPDAVPKTKTKWLE